MQYLLNLLPGSSLTSWITSFGAATYVFAAILGVFAITCWKSDFGVKLSIFLMTVGMTALLIAMSFYKTAAS